MGKAILAVFKLIVVIVGAAWLSTLLYAQFTCSLVSWIGRHCIGGEAEIWMLPAFTAGFGLPALIASFFIIWGFMRSQPDQDYRP